MAKEERRFMPGGVTNGGAPSDFAHTGFSAVIFSCISPTSYSCQLRLEHGRRQSSDNAQRPERDAKQSGSFLQWVPPLSFLTEIRQRRLPGLCSDDT